MQIVSTKAIAKIAAVATGLAMVAAASTFALSADAASLTTAQISSILSLLSSFGASSATIANVNAALTGTAVTTTTTTTGSMSTGSCSFSADLTTGSTGTAVTCLQDYLIAGGFSIPAGATGYFGAETVAAVAAWQSAHGVTPAAGYFGAKSRAEYAALGGSSSTTTTTTTGTGTVGIGSGNGLEVSLSPTSPSGTVLVQGQGIGDLGDFVFSNPTSAAVTVTGLTFNRIGVSNDQTINNVYLYNGVTPITDSAGVSNSQFAFTNAAGLFVVPAGTTYTVSVRADIATGTSGQQIGASLVSVASTGTLASTDSFPINSGYQTISAANLATVQYNATTLPNAATSISPQTGYTVWQNSVSVGTNPVWLKSMTFTNLGSIDPSDIGNFQLYVDGTMVGSAVPALNASRQVTFDLSANPLLLSTQTHIIKVLADVTGGASLDFQFSIQRSSDALFVDSQLGQPVQPTSNNSTTGFSAVNAAQVTVQSVSGSSGISVSKDPASQSNSVSKGATNVNWATFDMLASGEPTKVTDLYVCATEAIDGAGLANGKIYLNGVQVGSTKAIVDCATTPSGTDFSLGSSLILPAGQTAMVAVYADANTGVATSSISTNTNLPNNEVVTVKLVGQGSNGTNAQGQDSLQSASVPVTTTAGNGVTVSSSSLTASKFSGYANQTIIPGSQNALIGEFTLAAGSTEGVNVNTIGIKIPAGTDSFGNSAASELQNLKLVNMSTGSQIGTTLSTPSTGANSFSLGTNLLIPQSGSQTIGIYANVLSSATSSTTYSPLTSVSATATSGTGASTGTTASFGSDVTLQNITFGAGSLAVSLGASNPVAANVIAGASSLEAGDFTFNANNSSYTIQKLEVDVPNATAAALTSVSLKYTDVNGATQTATLSGASSVTSATTTYQFTGLTAYVASNSQADISVWVGTPSISSGGAAISGLPISVTINHGSGGANAGTFQAQDQSGSLSTYFGGQTSAYDVYSNANTGYGTLIVRKSIPTFTMLTNPNTTPSSGQSIYQFSIAADPANAVDVDQVSFSVATSSGVTLAGFGLYDITSGSAVQVGSSVPTITSGYVKFNLGANPQQIGAGQTKSYELIPATVTGWTGAGTSVTVSLAQDTTYAANVISTNSGLTNGNIIWSDRSATNHAAGVSTDWTNGYLLKNFVNDVTSYTHS